MQRLQPKNDRTRKQQKGLSLVELMIALVVSSLLMLGVFEVFVGSSGTDRIAHAYARVQENGRLAMDILTRHIRMAGYQGCIDFEIVDMNIIANNAPTGDLTGRAILGYETQHSGWNTVNRDNYLAPINGVHVGSDVIYVQYVSPTGVNVICPGGGNSCSSVSAEIKIDDNSIGLNKYDIAVVSDCENADMFRIVNLPKDTDNKTTITHSSSHNTSNFLSKPYGEDSEVMSFEALAFYTKDTGRNTNRGNPIYSLYQFDSTFHDGTGTGSYVTGREVELVEGIEQLQILYGQRLADGNLRFVDATDGNLDFAEVDAVRIGLLVSSSEEILTDPDNDTYRLPGNDIEPLGTTSAIATHTVDRRLRLAFTSTIVLRNRQ
ncbi:prepilin-type N-terminal cleavage/methylation domain-containing protein [Motiliproteus coralliicola]|uniref:Prepilin-type N-terminal cleavage/methylation domain-containing protein n=1 Tax=Motiliproteus coralliicola TaxID=2283196 RepID=A0A369WSF0_9GAMM|nr:PilW family protein [Motiliproteus coralliicola]RDE24103.1 prepilin-type N-terminal cleavage/methylation domain-containing protein [Motiliproteus coralliicola]